MIRFLFQKYLGGTGMSGLNGTRLESWGAGRESGIKYIGALILTMGEEDIKMFVVAKIR